MSWYGVAAGKWLGFALVASLGAANARAQIITESPEDFLPNSGPRGDVVVHEDDVVVRLPILWKNAARIDQPVSLAAAGKTQTLAAGTLLQAAAIKAPDRPAGWMIAFCTPERHGERALEHGLGRALFGGGVLTRQIAHNGASGQFCLFDPGADGHFSEVRYFFHGRPEGTPAEKLAPVSYAKLAMTPVSSSGQDEIRISAAHLGQHKLTLKVDIVQAGLARQFSTITMDGVTSKNDIDVIIDKPLPQSVKFIGVDFEVVSSDPIEKSVTIRFPESVDRNKILVIPEDTQIHHCIYGSCD
jgi:hypothetical protein